jgi:hypothetical protein
LAAAAAAAASVSAAFCLAYASMALIAARAALQ